MKFREITERNAFSGYVLVKSAERKQSKNGSFYLDLILCDGEADLVGKYWDYRGSDADKPRPETLWFIRGSINLYNNQKQLRVEFLRPVNPGDDVDISDYVPSTKYKGDEMYDALLDYVYGFADEELKTLTLAVLEAYKDRIVELPAAFRLHHAVRGGLMMHTLSICRMAEAAASLYPSVDRDLLLAGAILHDVAKCEEFSLGQAGLVDAYTAEGTLIGHLVKGAMDIDRIGREYGVSDATLTLIQHMLISHHGIPEFGAAVRPLFLEAEILSALDTLDANIYEIEDVVKDVAAGGFSNKIWALDDRKFYNHGRKKIVTDVRFDWHIEDGAPELKNLPTKWTEIVISVPVVFVDDAAAIVNMTVPYGIYIEDYSDVEEVALEIAKIDLIDEELVAKDRTKAKVHVYIEPDKHPAEAAQFITSRLEDVGIPYEMEIRNTTSADWENNWRDYFRPTPVGKKLFLRPVWVEEYDPGDRKVLNIEPGLAFGTGTHETTRLCMETMEDYVKPDTRMLDVGCGSGILSVAGRLLGAKSVLGVDIDEIAVKVAKENGRRNGFEGDDFRMIHGDLTDKVSGKFSLVTANIVADAILALTPKIIPFLTEDGVYIVSGIIDSRADEVKTCLSDNGFTVLEEKTDGGWVCIAARR